MKAAVIGLGRMGRRHVQALKDLKLDIVGAADPLAESREATAKEHGLSRERIFSDVGELLQRTRPESVVIASTAPGHAPLTIQAAEAGVKYILCEKPMAISLAECDRMIEACQRHGARLAINHQMRFMEQYTEVKRLIESPTFGGWTGITVVAGNFGLAMNGTHYFELLRWMAGEPVADVSAWFSASPVPSPRGPEFSDRAGQVRLRTRSGKRMYLDIGDDQGHGIRVVYAGRTGLAVADELGGTIECTVREAQYRELPTTRYGMPAENIRLTVAPADAVVPSRRVMETLISGGDIPTGEDGRAALEALVAAYVSAESGGTLVRTGDNLPRERNFNYA